MGKENPIAYLSQKDQRAVRSWTGEIKPIIDKSSIFKGTDLVVEGGVGLGITMRDISNLLFPRVVYVGTDLVHFASSPRLSKEVDDETITKIRANQEPTKSPVIWANCFDFPLIEDLKRKLGLRSAALVSLNGVNSLLSWKDLTPWESKRDEDARTVEETVSLDGPYDVQLHFGVNWEDNGATMLSKEYFRLEEVAKKTGWRTKRFDCGLLLTK